MATSGCRTNCSTSRIMEMSSSFTIGHAVDPAPLAIFRIFFGGIMVFAMCRFWYYGWIEKLYIEPGFHFKYWGFEWVRPIGESTYWLFLFCGMAAFLVMLGWRYRLAMVAFFLSFTYIELMDKTNYLNHYYFVSCISFLLCFLPANACFSLDGFWKNRNEPIPKWHIDAIRLMLCIVWFYAGLAKLNSDWLMEAQPLKIWLKAKYDVPVLGDFLQKEVVHYLFSWGGALYDLSIPFCLWMKKTRPYAFVAVVFFHVMTWLLFPIGVFPWVMIGSALVFFDGKELRQFFRLPSFKGTSVGIKKNHFFQQFTMITFAVFFTIQLLFPFRHLLYDGELFWTEQGFRFSWRVMLMEKAGYANFKVVDADTGKRFYVQNQDFLTPLQEKQMATQPDFIIGYAHFLKKHYRRKGISNPQVFVESFVALNGRSSRPYVKPNVDLTKMTPCWEPTELLEEFEEEIWGF